MPYTSKVFGRTMSKKCVVSETRTLMIASWTAVK